MSRDVMLGRNDSTGTAFKGHASFKFERAKTFKNLCNLRQLLTLIANISRMDAATNKR